MKEANTVIAIMLDYLSRLVSNRMIKKRNTTTFDDNKSQSACRFLMNLDQSLAFEDDAIHEAVMYALNAFCKAQYANGAWPQRYTHFTSAKSKGTSLRASFPKDWPRKYPAEKYGEYYTLNDQSICDTIMLMLDAWFIYEDPRYLTAAQRGGDFPHLGTVAGTAARVGAAVRSEDASGVG